MYIPKYPAVNIYELEDEMQIETEGLFEALCSYYGKWKFTSQNYVFDCIHSKYDANWNTIPAILRRAYEYLCEQCKIDAGKEFLWITT